LVGEIAIVGMGAMFPAASNAPAFWRNICSGTDAITDVPQDRWDPEIYCALEEGDGRFYCRRGGFLGDLAEFDPAPFGIMPAAVEGTEPDQLLMLRVAAEAIEDCGSLPDRERIGVIIGRGGYLTPGVARLDQRVRTAHQLRAVLAALVPGLSSERLDAVRAAFEERLGPDQPESSIGLVPNFAASRLANRFDLRGPAYTVDAACASSLVAVDHAVRELESGRCDAVLAGGVHTCHDPTLWSVFTRLRALSPAGVIRPLDASADGTLLSEGTGVVLLKRLADARDAGDHVYAVIRGTGMSSDGRATSMMNPLAEGQELAIRRAWAEAGLDPAAPDALGLLEAHGTATPVGDRAELTALGRVFGQAGGRPIGIGSVKSMIGHAMPAAGIAGLIKAAFAVSEGVLPPTLHVEEANPALGATRFEPVTAARPWDDGLVRRAAVNAFGFGGINAHVIIEAEGAAPSRPGSRPGSPPRPRRHRDTGEAIVRLAAPSAGQMAALLDVPAARLRMRLGEEPGEGPCRLAIVAPDERRFELARKVVARGTPWRGRGDIWFTPRPLLSAPEQVAFVFPGFEPDFAPRVEGIAEALGLAAPVLHGGDEVVEHALDVIAVGRLHAAALDALGITPGALAGHSLGEWTAMVVGGIYPDIDEFVASMRPGMVEVPDVVYLTLGASADRARELVSGLAGVALTHDNCPRQSVVCGPAGPIAEAASRARAAGILTQELPFRTGFHSPAYAPYAGPAREALRGLRVREPRVPVWSATSLTTFPRDADALRELVLRHLVEPVRFRRLTELLYDSGIRAFVQVGPGSLTGFAADTLAGRDHLAVATAAPRLDGLAQLRRAAAALWAEGLSPRFERLGSPVSGATPTPTLQRLKLGAPLVRLAGAVEPLAAGDGLGDPAAGDGLGDPAADGSALAELSAFGELPAFAELSGLLTDVKDAADRVVMAAKRSGGAAPGGAISGGTPSEWGPGPKPGSRAPASSAPQTPPLLPDEAVSDREFSLRTMPDMADHCLFPQAEGWPDDSDQFPVVPMTTLLEIMGDAALALAPGRVVAGFEQVRAVRWLAVAPAARTAVRAARDGQDRVRVSIEGYASGYVRLRDGYPAPPAPDVTPLREAGPAPVTARELYDDGWMFHGPRFAGVTDIAALAADGITGTVASLRARGALLDSAGQLIGHWMQVSATTDQTVLPTGIGAVRLYGPPPPDGQLLGCTAWVREVTDTVMRADAELRTDDGRVWCRIENWTTRRFACDDAIWRVKLRPESATLSTLAPDGWNVVRERWPDAASRELIMRRYLNAAERAEYERLNPLEQRRWLLSSIAVKDAVRRWLWDRGAGAMYPAELTVTQTDKGVRVRGPLRAPPVALAISRPGTPGRLCAAAIAGAEHTGSPAGVDAVLVTASAGGPRH
jgi:acyl transferase domain-containing protein